MTRFVLHHTAALAMVADGIEIAAEHRLLAPTLLRSQVLSHLHEAVVAGELTAEVARARREAVARIPLRLLGDAVLRRQAWDVADALGWASTYDAEYVALTQLQGDVLVTQDPELARLASALVKVATAGDLRWCEEDPGIFPP